MIALYLLAAHLVGDFVFQTRWQAVGKFGWSEEAWRLRSTHVATYCWSFLPVLVIAEPNFLRCGLFVVGLYVLHHLTDSRRFTSTLGDVIGWYWGAGARARREPEGFADWRTPQLEPNPWSPLPILIDQTLHIAQIAILAGLFLR